MKRSYFYPILSIFILLTNLLLSCSTPKALEYRDFKNFSIEKLGFSASSVKMDLIYYNPNNFGLQLKSTDLDVFLDNKFLGHTTLDYQVTIPKLQEFSIPVKLDVNMQNLLKNSITSLFHNEVTVKLTGSIKVGKANVFKNFPVLYEGKQTFTLF